jgi:hypothetical protein
MPAGRDLHSTGPPEVDEEAIASWKKQERTMAMNTMPNLQATKPAPWATSLLEKLVDVAFDGVGHPVRRYREVKDRIAHDLVFYANVIVPNGESPAAAAMFQARQRANRGRAAELEVAAMKLPVWYRKWLHRREEEPFEAARNLRGLADATNRERADRHIASIERYLKL